MDFRQGSAEKPFLYIFVKKPKKPNPTMKLGILVSLELTKLQIPHLAEKEVYNTDAVHYTMQGPTQYTVQHLQQREVKEELWPGQFRISISLGASFFPPSFIFISVCTKLII